MNTEIEVKLRITPQLISTLPHLLTPFEIKNTKRQQLNNIYFDTPTFTLSEQKSILRIRECNGDFTLTTKLKGTVTGGLHAHPEYNLSVSTAKPAVHLLEKAFNLTFPCQEKDLSPLFETNFERQCWTVNFLGSDIEVALDQGEICTQNQSEPICELECELKSGEPLMLFAFVDKLLEEQNGATFFAINKAKRGYALAFEHQSQAFDFFTLWQKEDATEIGKILSFLTIEQRLIDYFFQQEKERLSFHQTVELIGAFFHLYEEMNEVAFFQQLEQFSEPHQQAFIHAFGSHWQQDFAISRQMAKEKLQQIMQQHSQDLDNLNALQALENWLWSEGSRAGLLRHNALAFYLQGEK